MKVVRGLTRRNLSRQLYDKETHFLLELIQNADDNTYECTTPSLNFTYKRGSLRVDCNEIGFTESNVRAICSIGESTKAGLGRSTRYVGEKGIGFKSVFKVASVVYISSRSFSFKFDRSQAVGLIAPIWSEFPEPTLPGYTSFYLQLSEDCDENQITHEIRHLDPTMLIFLRQLRQINLKIVLGEGHTWTRRLWREDIWASGSLITRLHGGPTPSCYVVTKYLVSQLPEEHDRPGVLESEILLAFPILDIQKRSEENTQSVYAFLPIRDYGFKTLDAKGFLQHLVWKISNEPQDFRRKPGIWHSRLAKALLSFGAESEHSALMKSLEIIPLSNGDWVSADVGPIYFSQGSERLSIPQTIPIRTVNRVAERDSVRHNLFVHLGIRPRPDAADICHRIIEMHRNGSFKPDSLTEDQLVEHIVFIFKVSFDPPPGVDLWFATASNQRAKGSSLYIRANVLVGSAEDRIRQHVETNYPLLHEAYANAFDACGPARITWRTWIRRCFGIQPSSLPRICTAVPNVTPRCSLRLSNEFRSLFKACDSSDVLELLRVKWREYSQVVEQVFPVNGKTLWNPVRDEIAAMEVKCYTGMGSTSPCSRPLQNTFLPSLDKTMDQYSRLPMLNIPNPSIPSWKILGTFGVSVDRNLEYYFQCLHTLKDHAMNPSKLTVAHVYQRIQADYMDNKKKICRTFMQERLIYTSLGSSESDPKMRWINGQECLEENLDIVAEYQGSTTLFRNVLGARTDNIGRMVHALSAITEEVSLSYILESFTKVNRAIQAQGTQNSKAAVEGLDKWVPIFPIMRERSDKEYDALAPLKPAFPPWFIADRDHLRDSFLGYVEILAFSPQDLESIQDFLKVVDLDSRVLSKIVKVETSPFGKPKRNKACTLSLQRKAAFIAALIPKQRPNRDALVREFFRVEVNVSARIVQKYTFEYGGRSFSGNDGQGEVSLSEHNGRLQVFMTRDNISAMPPPLELMNGICDRYDITNPVHRNLVQFALSEDSQERLLNAFARQGVHVLESLPRDFDSGYAALWRDEFLDTRMSEEEGDEEDPPKDILESKFKRIPAMFVEYRAEEDDRRLPLQYFKWSERILYRSTSCDPSADYRTVLRMEPAHAQYVAEVLTSRFLRHELGDFYKPDDHWTSPQRYKAGHRKFLHSVASHATFTIANREASRKISAFLAQRHFEAAKAWAWAASDPTYHFDIAVSSGGPKSEFSWTTQQFERMRKFRTDKQLKDTWRLENVHVLVRVSDVFTNPSFNLFVDPWRLFSLERFTLQGNWTIAATILDESHDGNEVPTVPGPSCGSEYQLHSPPASTSAFRCSSNCGVSLSSSSAWMDPSNTVSSQGDIGHCVPQQSNFGPYMRYESFTVDRLRQQQPWSEQNPYLLGQGSHQSLHSSQTTMPHQQVQIGHPVQSTPASRWPWQPYQTQIYQSQGASGQWSCEINHSGWSNNGGPWSISADNAPLGMAAHNRADRHGFLPTILQESPYATPNSSTEHLCVTIPTSDVGAITNFSYKPLNKGDIRLLMLHPGQQDAQLRAVVYRCSLLLANSFQAISYTWGNPELSHSLWTPDGNIKITASLYATLRCLRHEAQPLVLWTDGVCVNQSDKKEKTEQIQLLPQVFQRATCVLVCLGSDSSGDGAMETLMQIRVNDALRTLGEEWPKDLAHIPPSWKKKSIPPADDSTWTEIGALFERPWFERAWIIQEVVVATSVRVVCGKWMIDWNDLFAALEVITRESRASPKEPLGMAQPKWRRFLTLAKLREREAKHDRRPLLELLEDFRDSKSSIDHDRFFCLLGLAIDGNNKDFVLDYRLSFDAIVRKYAWAFIRQGKVMELLYRAGIGSRQANCFPSWIPDWTVAKPGGLRTLSTSGMPCAASRRAEPRVDVSSMTNDLELRLYGIKVDVINVVSKSSNIMEELRLYLDEVDNMVRPASPRHWESLKWNAPIAGASRCKVAGLSMKESYTALRKYLAMEIDESETSKPRTKTQQMVVNDPAHSSDSKDSLWAQSQNYYLALQGNLVGWKFVVTERECVGIVPPAARQGDVVSVIDGGMVPFLLREVEGSGGSFSLVGECYVHGLMNGEAGTLDLPEEVISLR
ncbi:hypothetical protein DL768_001874 [Monosporascus sp. mg162]|nr:hypothetical protein DL768_001874 [Monosporascus sp. mg162]